jgi:hypothetical protein
MATKSKQQAQALADEPQGAQQVPEEPGQGASAPEPVKHRLVIPVAPAAKTDADNQALRHLRAALEQAGYRNHPQALEAGLEAAELVPAMRAGPEVQVYKAEVLDYLRGKIQQRDARKAAP